MAVNKVEILDAIAQLTVLELSSLIKDMEEKFGVSAAAVAVAAPAAGGGARPGATELCTPWCPGLGAAAVSCPCLGAGIASAAALPTAAAR